MDQPNLTQARLCACANLRMAARAATKFFDEILQPSGLQITQFSLLATLALAGPVPMTQLAEMLGMDRTTLTRNLKPLEKQGLVTIGPGADGRTRLVRLATQGEEALAKALPLWEKAQAQAINTLGAERFNAFLTDLSAVKSLAY